jgi:glycosyltransferase involved in cell wall biosynthesis
MAERGRDILKRVHGVSDAKMVMIPHGVPDRAFADPDTFKPAFGWEGHDVVLTFGLLAPNKGIETMIEAMPAIVAARPEALYVVLGATHPNLVANEGEAYRDRLAALAAEKGVAGNVRFIDAFVEQDELIDYLQAADIYATPYTNPAQITSGTLSYAVGVGKAVISTPYVHATEILADGHGMLVDFRDSAGFAREISKLLSDKAALTPSPNAPMPGAARCCGPASPRMRWSNWLRSSPPGRIASPSRPPSSPRSSPISPQSSG